MCYICILDCLKTHIKKWTCREANRFPRAQNVGRDWLCVSWLHPFNIKIILFFNESLIREVLLLIWWQDNFKAFFLSLLPRHLFLAVNLLCWLHALMRVFQCLFHITPSFKTAVYCYSHSLFETDVQDKGNHVRWRKSSAAGGEHVISNFTQSKCLLKCFLKVILAPVQQTFLCVMLILLKISKEDSSHLCQLLPSTLRLDAFHKSWELLSK